MTEQGDISIDIEKIRSSKEYREITCKAIYQNTNLKNAINHFVIKHGGQSGDFEEVFQETIVRFIKQIMKPSFQLNNSLEAYLFGIARYVCLEKFKNNYSTIPIAENLDLNDSNIQTADQELLEAIHTILHYATASCQQVLMYWANNYKMTEIATFMGYKSEMMARKKKYNCIQKLISFFENNPKLRDQILPND